MWRSYKTFRISSVLSAGPLGDKGVVGAGSDGGQHLPETDRKLYLDISVTHTH